MSPARFPAGPSRWLRLHAVLLRLYPPAFHALHGAEMREVAAQMLAEGMPRRRLFSGYALSLVREHARAFADAWTAEPLLQTNVSVAFAGGLLLLPGAALLGFASLLALIHCLTGHAASHPLFAHPLYQPLPLTIELILFPVAALALNALLLAFAAIRGRLRARYATLLLYGPNAALMLLALGLCGAVLLHDAVFCFVTNPVSAILHWNETVQCIHVS